MQVEVLLDSMYHTRLTTFLLTYPRFIHAQMLAHRQPSRNSSSSRAVPTSKMLSMSMVYPSRWGANRPGMVATEELWGLPRLGAQACWTFAGYSAKLAAWGMLKCGLHKQVANRVLEPYTNITTVISATTWENFFTLRCEDDAQPEMQELALLMKAAYLSSQPVYRREHLPFLEPSEWSHPKRREISAARCARASYLTHLGTRDVEKDIALAARLKHDKHLSPAEHPCYAAQGQHANFNGWFQLRKEWEVL